MARTPRRLLWTAHRPHPGAASGYPRDDRHTETASGGAEQREEGAGRREAEADAQVHAEEDQAALGKEANKVRKGQAKTRSELNEEAARLGIRGRSKMGKDQLRRAIQRAR